MPENAGIVAAGIVAGRGGLLPGPVSLGCTRSTALRHPENVGSRFLSLLQSAPAQTLSILGAARTPNCRRLCASGLRVRERNDTAKLLSGGHFFFLGLGPFTLQPLFSSEFNSLVSLARLKVDIPFAERSRRSAAHRALPLWQNLACIRPAFRPSKLSARSLPLWSRCAP